MATKEVTAFLEHDRLRLVLLTPKHCHPNINGNGKTISQGSSIHPYNLVSLISLAAYELRRRQRSYWDPAPHDTYNSGVGVVIND